VSLRAKRGNLPIYADFLARNLSNLWIFLRIAIYIRLTRIALYV
jgi:hypothetical protein